MLLYNQRGAAISWEALGKVYKWDAYGTCEVPDELVEHIRLESFPVDTAPVPPKEKAERAAALLTDDSKTAEIERLRKELADSEAREVEAKRSAESAEARATAARAEVDALETKLRASEVQNAAFARDAGEYEKMIADLTTENTKLKGLVKVEEVAKQQSNPKK